MVKNALKKKKLKSHLLLKKPIDANNDRFPWQAHLTKLFGNYARHRYTGSTWRLASNMVKKKKKLYLASNGDDHALPHQTSGGLRSIPTLRGPAASPVGQDRGGPIFRAAAAADHVAVPGEEGGGEVGVVDSGRRDARDRGSRAST